MDSESYGQIDPTDWTNFNISSRQHRYTIKNKVLLDRPWRWYRQNISFVNASSLLGRFQRYLLGEFPEINISLSLFNFHLYLYACNLENQPFNLFSIQVPFTEWTDNGLKSNGLNEIEPKNVTNTLSLYGTWDLLHKLSSHRGVLDFLWSDNFARSNSWKCWSHYTTSLDCLIHLIIQPCLLKYMT